MKLHMYLVVFVSQCNKIYAQGEGLINTSAVSSPLSLTLEDCHHISLI